MFCNCTNVDMNDSSSLIIKTYYLQEISTCNFTLDLITTSDSEISNYRKLDLQLHEIFTLQLNGKTVCLRFCHALFRMANTVFFNEHSTTPPTDKFSPSPNPN